MGVSHRGSVFLQLLIFYLTIRSVVTTSKYYSDQSNGTKLNKINSKFHLTSTYVGDAEKIWFNQKKEKDKENPNHRNHSIDCLQLNLFLPEIYDPICLCLKQQNFSKSAFHKKFRLNMIGKENQKKTFNLKKLMGSGMIVVNGHVKGIGVSYINGYIKDKNFYGTIIFSHLIGKRMIMCSITPRTTNNLQTFMDLSSIEDDELEQILVRHTIKIHNDENANAIVSCGDMHRDDDHDVKNPFNFIGKSNPTNVIINKTKKQKQNKIGYNDEHQLINLKKKIKRHIIIKRNGDPDEAPGPFDNPNGGKITMPPPKTSENLTKPLKPEKLLTKLFSKSKNRTYFANVCYIVDMNYLERRFNGSPEDATVLLGGFVDLADWILRSTDFDSDGIPDNIGVRLLEVSVEFITEQLRTPGEKWGREPGGKFMMRRKLFKIVRDVGGQMSKECDIRSAIGEINTGKYALYDRGGCTACKTKKLTSFTNPYVERFSQRGEYLRMLYHQIRLIAFGFVSDGSLCANCTGFIKKSKVGTFDEKKDTRGACIIEGDLLARSNIPLNSFRLSTCSISEGAKCFRKIALRPNCLSYEVETSYCGNGIVEGDEECDCGTLATCIEQRCDCGPRTGVTPCRVIEKEDTELCMSLIKCRGYRFLYELGKPNSTQFISNIPDLMTLTRTDGQSSSSEGNSPNSTSKGPKILEINFWFGLACVIGTLIYIYIFLMSQ